MPLHQLNWRDLKHLRCLVQKSMFPQSVRVTSTQTKIVEKAFYNAK